MYRKRYESTKVQNISDLIKVECYDAWSMADGQVESLSSFVDKIEEIVCKMAEVMTPEQQDELADKMYWIKENAK